MKIRQIIGFPTKMLSIFKMLYGEANCKIQWNGKCSKPFMLRYVLKQGCNAVCLFFNIFFAVVLHAIHQKLTNGCTQLCFRLDGSIFDVSFGLELAVKKLR